jgi:hypothetical protein
VLNVNSGSIIGSAGATEPHAHVVTGGSGTPGTRPGSHARASPPEARHLAARRQPVDDRLGLRGAVDEGEQRDLDDRTVDLRTSATPQVLIRLLHDHPGGDGKADEQPPTSADLDDLRGMPRRTAAASRSDGDREPRGLPSRHRPTVPAGATTT